MSNLVTAHEAKIEAVISDFVRNRLALGVYDPAQIRRAKVEIASFQIELLEIDETDSVAHAAGPVVLRTPQGDVKNFLRLSLAVRFEGDACWIPDGGIIRAAYVVETDHPNGACKETAALANV